MSRDNNNCVAVMCVCGGWVMLAVLGHSAKSDRETWREAGEMAAKGYTVRTPITVGECRYLPPCKHRGDCTTNPEKVLVEQTDLLAGGTP